MLAPMTSELRPLVRLLSLRREAAPGLFSHRGQVGGVEVLATRTGIGVRRAALATERALDSGPLDHVMVVGVAGGIGESVAIGDLVVPEVVLDLASGARYRPVALGDVPARGILVTSDGLIDDPEVFARLGPEVVAVDMETAAVAEVCSRRGCGFSVFRGISDHADDRSIDAAVFGLAGEDGRPDLAAVARFLARRPGRARQLVRLARGLRRATSVAAAAAARALS